MFQSARGETREAKEKNACTGCELFPTKNKFKLAVKIEETVNEVEFIWLENRSGYRRELKELTPLQADCLIIWQDALEKIQSAQLPRLEEILLAVNGIQK